MSDQRHKIPKIERPEESADQSVSLERDTLEKSKSAAYRDAHERMEHQKTLNNRIDVLQSKLNKRENDLCQSQKEYSDLRSDHSALLERSRGGGWVGFASLAALTLGGAMLGTPKTVNWFPEDSVTGAAWCAIVTGIALGFLAQFLHSPKWSFVINKRRRSQ